MKKKTHKRKSYKSKTKNYKNSILSNFNTFERSEVKRMSVSGKNVKSESNKKIFNDTNDFNINNLDITDVKDGNIEIEKDNKNNTIIKKIKFNFLYTYFCILCLRRKKNLQNELIDKGMKLIYQELDIFNIFKKLYIFDKIGPKINLE